MKGLNRLGMYWEKYYPLILSIMFTSFLFLFFDISSLPTNFEKILDVVITFVSIILGFLGVLMSILLTLRDTKLLEEIFKKIDQNLFKGYFSKSIIDGFLLVILSLLFFFPTLTSKISSFNTKVNFLLLIWIFSLLYFIISSYRIIDIMMVLIFKEHNFIDKKQELETLSDEKIKKLNKNLRK